MATAKTQCERCDNKSYMKLESEIARLSAINKTDCEDYAKIKAEVERLRVEYDSASDAMIAYQTRGSELFTEVERLRRRLSGYGECPDCGDMTSGFGTMGKCGNCGLEI